MTTGRQVMRKYDAVFIYQTGADTLTTGKELVAKEFSSPDIKLLEEQDMGERDLAYEIKKMNRGHYIRYELELDPEAIQSLQKALKLRPEILKFVFFKKDS
jgi:small subunit ribosomal protein S6